MGTAGAGNDQEELKGVSGPKLLLHIHFIINQKNEILKQKCIL